MGLITNVDGTSYDDTNEALQQARKAQLDAYNAVLVAAGETPAATQSDTDTFTAQDAQTGSQFQIQLEDLAGGGGAATAAQTLTAIKTVDGAGSGLDADLLDGQQAAAFALSASLGDLAPLDTIAVPTHVTATGTPSGTTYLRGDGAWATPAGGGGATGAPGDPIVLAPVQWMMLVTYDTPEDAPWYASYDFDTKTTTADDDGALGDLVHDSADELVEFLLCGHLAGVSPPQLGDRVFLMDESAEGHQGVYTITDLGSVASPWVLTQVPENDDPTDALLSFSVALAGTTFYATTAPVAADDDFNDLTPYGWVVMDSGGFAAGAGAQALGRHSVAIGEHAVALGESSFAIGRNARVGSEGSVAIGDGAVVPSEIDGIVIGAATLAVANTVLVDNAVIRNYTAFLSYEVDPADNVIVDFRYQNVAVLYLAGDTTFVAAGLTGGVSTTVQIICDATPRSFTFPGDWVWVGGTAPAGIDADQTAMLTLTCYDTIVASYALEDTAPGGGGDAIPASLINAKGDLIVGIADSTVEVLGVGTDGYVLTASSGSGSGVIWNPAGVGTLDDLVDVDTSISPPASGDVLTYVDGVGWLNQPPAVPDRATLLAALAGAPDDSGLNADTLDGFQAADLPLKYYNLSDLPDIAEARTNLGLATVTGVAVTVEAVHAALVSLGLITA